MTKSAIPGNSKQHMLYDALRQPDAWQPPSPAIRELKTLLLLLTKGRTNWGEINLT
ncbi:hypothetical protein [Serratia quinivorans]|uniref:hypothetical protein n=1 Tax=Serratia quinivorans TaxID=137545 RepID=UPI0021B6E7DD|nr:hypothetical protein [Serratia quinivorans]